MADLQRTIEFLFNGVDNVSSTVGTIGSSLTKFGETASKLGEPFANITKGVAALDLAITGLAIAALKANSDIEQQTTKMANALGLPTAEAEKFKEVAVEAYGSGIGESLEDAFAKVTQASGMFKDASVSDLETIVSSSEKLSKTFGSDYSENLGAVQTLMQNFGITSEQAFDLITTGFQKGLNGSGDFLESITEYAPQFSSGGADAGQFFSVLESGFQNGVNGTDKAADQFKEFRVRIQDDSKTTKESLQSIGIDPVAFAKDLDSGKMSAVQAFQIIQDKLKEVDDKGVQFRASVGLMGTQFEDMGNKSGLSLDATKTKIEDLSGAIKNLKVDESLGTKFENAFKTISTTIADAKLFDNLGDDLGDKLDDIKSSFKEAFKDVDFTELENALDKLFETISDTFSDMDLDLTTVEGMENAIQLVVDSIESLVNVTDGIADVFSPIIDFAKDAVSWFNQLSPATQTLIGQITGFGTAVGIAGTAVATGGTLLVGLNALANVFGVGGNLRTGIQSAQTALSTLAATPAFKLTASFAIGWTVGSQIRELSGGAVDEFMQGIFKDIDKVINFTGQMGEFDLGFEKEQTIDVKAETSTIKSDVEGAFLKVEDFEISASLKKDENFDTFFSSLEAQDIPKIDIHAELYGDDEITDFFGKVEDKAKFNSEVDANLNGEDELIDFFGKIDGYAKFNSEVNADLNGDDVVNSFFDTVDNYDESSSIIEASLEGAGAVNSFFDTLDDYDETYAKIEASLEGADGVKTELQKVGTRADGSPIMAEIEAKLKGDDKVNTFFGSFDGKDEFDTSINASLQGDDAVTDFFGTAEDNAEFDTSINASLQGDDEVKTDLKALTTPTDPLVAKIKAQLEETSKNSVNKELVGIGKNPDGSWIYAEVTAKAKDVDKVKTEIETIPTEKMLEIKLQGDIDTKIQQIKTSGEVAQAAFEWTAKVDIAQAEASSKQAVAAFDAIGQSVESLSTSTSSMFGDLLNNWNQLSATDQSKFSTMVEDQQELLGKALQSQIDLNRAQTEYMQAKAQALSSGDGLINIDATGLEPALETVMWQIIEKVQLKANEDAAAFLLGI